jgi:hypothetical protein
MSSRLPSKPLKVHQSHPACESFASNMWDSSPMEAQARLVPPNCPPTRFCKDK